jgi:predicted GH43/DUF377 family glycosyl hydrolase
MKKEGLLLFIAFTISLVIGCNNPKPVVVSESVMKQIYEEIITPFKYGLVMIPPDDSRKIDCPSIFRKDGKWNMSYLIYDGRGYETWLAESNDLLHWETKGRIMSFSGDSTRWDWNQKAGYVALLDYEWGGTYKMEPFDGKYWMSYFGGNSKGYESGILSIGIAYTDQNPATVHEWKYLDKPVLSPADKDVRWWENSTQYKSSIVRDKERLTGHSFVMYYNARGDSLNPGRGAERIGMAVSDDMKKWDRFMKNPVINHHKGISGDAYIQKIGDVYVMFYFGAFWNKQRSNAFNRFACSYDLVNWTDWTGEDLIAPTESFDDLFAHKSCVVKWDGVVYHFYCAVNKKQQRGIAVATSKDLGKSEIGFEKK